MVARPGALSPMEMLRMGTTLVVCCVAASRDNSMELMKSLSWGPKVRTA
jgi:hypothetical protein